MEKFRPIKRLVFRVTRADTASYAAALAYNFLFALFPLLLFLTALLGWLHLPSVNNFFAGPANVLVAPNVRHLILAALAAAHRRRSPALLSIGAVGFIWVMSGALRQLIDALNHAWGYKKLQRPIWKTVLLSLGLGILVGILLTLSEAVVTFGGDLVRLVSAHWLRQLPDPLLVLIIRWGVLLATMWILLIIIYNWLPDHRAHFRWFTPGMGLAMTGWVLISLGFSYYAAHFNRYNLTYGTLGGVILLMLYLYILAFILLLAIDLDATWPIKDGSEP
nr:YihY/virulence factor BrkB family protein [Sulfobacillus harzensis]